MSTFHLIHGLPGTGKTTFAGRLRRETGSVLVNHDERMIALHGRNPPAADMPRLVAEVSAQLWLEAARLAGAGQDVILDWGFWTRADRDDARRRAQAAGAHFILYRMDCPLELARERTVARSRTDESGAMVINGSAWDSFQRRFESLGPDEDHRDVVAETRG